MITLLGDVDRGEGGGEGGGWVEEAKLGEEGVLGINSPLFQLQTTTTLSLSLSRSSSLSPFSLSLALSLSRQYSQRTFSGTARRNHSAAWNLGPTVSGASPIAASLTVLCARVSRVCV